LLRRSKGFMPLIPACLRQAKQDYELFIDAKKLKIDKRQTNKTSQNPLK
jgi:hypothetical protein